MSEFRQSGHPRCRTIPFIAEESKTQFCIVVVAENTFIASQWAPFPVVRKKWSDQANLDPDTRIMSLHVCMVQQMEIVVTGNSDGWVKFLAVPTPENLVSIGSLGPLSCCILQIRLLSINGKFLLFVCGTDGFIFIFDVTNDVEQSLQRIDSNITEQFLICREHYVKKLSGHQSGVDGLDILCHENHENHENQLLVASSGDDGAIRITFFPNIDAINATDVITFGKSDAHCAQVSGNW